ncbi:integrase [Salmonella enterica subsp. enterica serovar Veneziana]|nr:integrase [Salmonella enterica subsp. enterica serovar Veneziana]ECJ8655488.1 integrase [Salmonella enterica subsp. enterica serovar Veneziana]
MQGGAGNDLDGDVVYKDERGEEFAQKLLGHTSENTTKLYLDERDNKAYVML